MIAGKKHWLWRAVDQDGVVLDVLVQSRRDKRAAKRCLRKKAADAAPACHDHGQAGELRRRQGRGDALGRAPEAQGPCMGTSMSRFEFSGSVPPGLLGGKTVTS